MGVDQSNGTPELSNGYVGLWDEKWNGEEKGGRSGDAGGRVRNPVACGGDESAEEEQG